MAQLQSPEASRGPQNDEAAFQAFQEHRWDLDKDFLVSHHSRPPPLPLHINISNPVVIISN